MMKTGAVRRRSAAAPTTSIVRLIIFALRRKANRRELDQRQPFERVDLDARAHDLEEPRDDVDLDVGVVQRAHRCERLVGCLVRERDDDALDADGS